ALKRLRDPAEAEDVSQEVFLTVFRVLGSYQGGSSLLVWIFGITRNTVNRRFRRKRPKIVSLDDDSAVEISASTAPADEAVEARRVLRRCEEIIEFELTPLQRRIFHLKHLRSQSIRAIATALGKSEDSVKANLYRMRCSIADAAPGLSSVIGATR
ncbi:MAG: sigma-70 family RNA polymerase sigma factor, partial [Myxococcota bacterium]